MNNKTIIEFGLNSYHMKNYGDLGGNIRLGLRPPRITPPSISIILHKILNLIH